MQYLEMKRTGGAGYLSVGTPVIIPHDLPDGDVEWIRGEVSGVVQDLDISFYEVVDDQGYEHRVALRGVWVQYHSLF